MCVDWLCPDVGGGGGGGGETQPADQKPLIVQQQRPRPVRPLDAPGDQTLVLITPIHAACRSGPEDERSAQDAGVKEATHAAPRLLLSPYRTADLLLCRFCLTDVVSSLSLFLSSQIVF